VSRNEWLQVLLGTDGSDSGTTTTVRDGKGLVQVQMTDISSDYSRGGESELSVKVSSIEVDLSTIGVNDVTNFFDASFEDTMS